MNDEFKEQLSALVDDELRREETAFLLRRVERTPEAVGKIGRYCLAREALTRNLPPAESWRLAARVSVALEDEAAHRRSVTWLLGRRALKPVAGLAVAASVATVSVFIWSGGERGGLTSATVAGQTSVEQQTRLVAEGGGRDGAWERLDPQVQQRLNGYLVNHSEHSSSGHIGSVLTYARIAGHESDE